MRQPVLTGLQPQEPFRRPRLSPVARRVLIGVVTGGAVLGGALVLPTAPKPPTPRKPTAPKPPPTPRRSAAR